MPSTTVSPDNLLTDKIRLLLDNLTGIMYGEERKLQWLLAAFFCNGHVLLEDVPGTGKTTMAKTLAASCNAEFQRIQFTPDLLPSDILGMSIFDQHQQSFRFEKGPVFCNILLADEINRASPRTQSALLEAMEETQVSIDRDKHYLPRPFFVVATQNPFEFHGTYPLPEAQLDRFAMSFGLGYVSLEDECNLLLNKVTAEALEKVQTCINISDLHDIQKKVRETRISKELVQYIVTVIRATRTHEDIKLGASPRASLTLMNCAKALALQDGFEFVTPDHIRELAIPVISHRLCMHAKSQFTGSDKQMIVNTILNSIKMPK